MKSVFVLFSRRLNSLVVVALCFFALSAVASAAGTSLTGISMASPSQSPCRDEIRAWAARNIVPVVSGWKNEFDAKLTSTELAQLNELRLKAQPLRIRRDELVQQIGVAMRNRDEQEGDRLRKQMRELRNDWEELTEQLIPIARKHRDELVALGAKATPIVREWRSTMRAKLADCMAAQPAAQTEGVKRMSRFLSDFLSDERQESVAMRKRAAARFLLWDGYSLPRDEQFSAGEAESQPLDKTNLNGTFTLAQCSPNPVNGSRTSIRFSLSQAGNVKISVLDIHGNEVDVVADRQFAAGTNVLEYNCSALVNGQYSIRLVSADGMLYTAMIVAR